MVFPRPAHVPYPAVHSRFTVTRQGAPVALRVQDLTEPQRGASLDLLTKYFTRDEPPCKYIGINNYPNAVKELQKLWRETMNDDLSLVCVEDRDDDEEMKIIAVNVLTVVCKGDKEEPFQTEDKIWAKLFGAVELVSKAVDVFAHFGVDKYLTAYGLVVCPEWRGLNIGRHMLEARLPLCRSLGVPATATVFTAAASQALAQKAGFRELVALSYAELARQGFRFPGVERDTDSSKLMGRMVEADG